MMNLPNKLTLIRVLLIPIFVIILLCDFIAEPLNSHLALVIFVIASITDFLDGYLARKLNLVTNFGKFMDPLADKLLVASAMICLIDITYIPAWVVIVIVSREFIITGLRLVAAESGRVIAASFWGKIKTTTQMVMIIYLLLGFDTGIYKTIGYVLIYAATIFTVISGVDYIIKNKDVLKD